MFYLGIDVSRDKLDCAVVDEEGQRIKRARTFANDTQGVNGMIGWARAAACEQPCCFVMEATAADHELAATRLHCAGLVVSVVNPALARSLAKGLGMLSKTDTIDALLLAQYARLAKPRQWHPVAAQLQQFSALLIRLDCLEADLRREQNRREQAVVRGTCECVIASIDSCIAFLKIQCKAMRQAIEAHIQANAALRDGVARLRTIPAVGEKTANRMVAVLESYHFEAPRTWRPSWAWCLYSASRVRASRADRDCPRRVILACAQPCTWPP